jgi:transposase
MTLQICSLAIHIKSTNCRLGVLHNRQQFVRRSDTPAALPKMLYPAAVKSDPWSFECRRIQAVIPTRSDQPPDQNFDRETYRRRNVVERCVGWMKENRRLGTRPEKLAITFTAMAKWAIVRRYFPVLDSSDRT